MRIKLSEKGFTGCNYSINEKNLKEINYLKKKKIGVDVHNYRNWIVNSIRIITSRSRYVSDTYKQRFKSNISVEFEDGTFVTLEELYHGDEKDHISLTGNTIIQSIDVHLDNGNIRGITKFKLLRPNTKGNLKTKFFNRTSQELALAPRTMRVDVRINEANSMIFQEKAAKELLSSIIEEKDQYLRVTKDFFLGP